MFGYIKLVFYTKRVNFGDMASPYLLHKLTGKKIIHKNFYEGDRHSWEIFMKAIKSFNFRTLIENLLPFESNIVAIGSILARGNTASKIWGAGFIDSNDVFYGGNVYAVRGKYSSEKLVRMGFDKCEVYGDPALLLPLVYSPQIEKKYTVGLVTHIVDEDALRQKYGDTIKIISLASENIEGVIDEILSCSFIYSTSLHGLIVSHTYGIPAVYVTNNRLWGDGIKFKDYLSSVGISPYDGYPLDEIDLANINVEDLVHKYSSKCLPKVDVSVIRRRLLLAAPFKVRKDIMKLV